MINLSKDLPSVSMVKTPVITATATWPATTDYDVYALLLLADGTTDTVAMFAANGVPAKSESHGVRHLGDVGRSKGAGKLGRLLGRGSAEATETIEIRWSPDLVAVVPVVYSAQSNGSGSFRAHRVSMHISNGAGDDVTIAASNASSHPSIYTCVPGIIVSDHLLLRVSYLEKYSSPGSEYRPVIKMRDGRPTVYMDKGPRNEYK